MEKRKLGYCLLGILFLISIGAGEFVVAHSLRMQQRPNVIIILTDDQGFGDLSCHGNPVLQTPAIDRLYNESIRLDNFHASPLCTPTRGQLITGLDALNNMATTVGRGFGLMRSCAAYFLRIERMHATQERE